MSAPMKSSNPGSPRKRAPHQAPAPRIVPFGALLQSGGAELDFEIELPPRLVEKAKSATDDPGVPRRV